MAERPLTDDERTKVDFAAEVFLDFIATAAEGKDDDDVVSVEPEIRALADACGIDWTGEAELITAGELRARMRQAKAALAKGDGP